MNCVTLKRFPCPCCDKEITARDLVQCARHRHPACRACIDDHTVTVDHGYRKPREMIEIGTSLPDNPVRIKRLVR